jgi:class 3 adenylate cyclase/tetratricopeptide (TPR) repeat protein
VICGACGTENLAGTKFCRECGTRLSVICGRCETLNPAGAKFCGECGANLAEPGSHETVAPVSATTPTGPLPATADAPGLASRSQAERRLVTVLFADLVGFTTLAEDRDPEETRELLTRYFDASRGVVERYGGVVEKFIGDAVMAVWGTPVAHEDDAERAVRAGLDLVEAVRAIGESTGRGGLEARVGILTGEAAVTLGATGQGMVAGDIVNTASRLQSVAPAGSVLVAEATRQASGEAIAYEAAGEQTLKGKQAPVSAHVAKRVVGRRRGEGRSDQLEAPFVGRQTELRVLKELVHAVGEERRPRVVSVLGQAGIGKSRLAWELQKYLDGVTEVLYWHQGRCPAYGEGMSYWALAEMVRGRVGIGEGDPADLGLRKLHAMLEQFVPDAEERRWIERPLRELLGHEPDPGEGTTRETVFAAWRTLFERISEQGTAILVFEDLQWADPGLLDFIEHLHQWARHRPIFILVLARPELLDRRADWAAGWRNASSLTLEPLPAEPMRELLGGLVPGLPETALARILERAEGIPLYAVETVRMLLTEGRIEPSDGVYRPTADLTDLAVPDSLHALVAARLDAIEPDARQIVAAASVIGKTFTIDSLARVADRDPVDLEPLLRDLVRRVLLTVESDPRSPERGQYGFVQSLVREVAYSTLGRGDRRRLHLAAARYYESLGDEELAGVLAGHYLDAYQAHPDGPEGEAVAAQARLALRAAAERATNLGSHDQAYDHLLRALEVARDDSERADLVTRAGRAAFKATRLDAAVPLLQEAIELHRQLGDRPAELLATVTYAYVLIAPGHLPEAAEVLMPAAERFADLEGTLEFLELTEACARVQMRLGKGEETLEWCDRGLRSPAAAQHARLALELLVTRGTVLGSGGRQIEAMAMLRGALALAEEHALPEVQARAYINLGFVAGTDEPRTMFNASRDGLELVLRIGMPLYLPFLVVNIGEGAMRLGEWDTFERLVAPALELDLGPEIAANVAATLSVVRGARGEPYQDLIDQLVAHHSADDPQHSAGLDSALAEVALADGRFDEAVERALRSLETMSEAVSPSSQLTIGRVGIWSGDAATIRKGIGAFDVRQGRLVDAGFRELEAGLAALEGRADEASAVYADVLREHEALGTVFSRAVCQIGMLAVLPPGSRMARAAEEEARATLTELRAAPYLERLDEVLERAGRLPASPAHDRGDAARDESAPRVAG